VIGKELVPVDACELLDKREPHANAIGYSVQSPAKSTLRVREVADVAAMPDTLPACDHIPRPVGHRLDCCHVDVTSHFSVSRFTGCFLGFLSFPRGVSVSTLQVCSHCLYETTRQGLKVIDVGIGPERVSKHGRHRNGLESHRQHLDPPLLDAVGRRHRQLVLAPLGVDRSRRDEGDQKVALADLLRDHLDQRVADFEDDTVVSDLQALLRLQMLDKREDELLVFVGVANQHDAIRVAVVRVNPLPEMTLRVTSFDGVQRQTV
jgi:hypothetical protein